MVHLELCNYYNVSPFQISPGPSIPFYEGARKFFMLIEFYHHVPRPRPLEKSCIHPCKSYSNIQASSGNWILTPTHKLFCIPFLPLSGIFHGNYLVNLFEFLFEKIV